MVHTPSDEFAAEVKTLCATTVTDQQWAALLEAVDGRYRAFLALAAFAGLRLGETAGRGPSTELRQRACRVPRRRPRLDALGTRLGLPVGNAPTRWLFEATPGQPPHQNTIGHAWRQACRRAGIGGFTLHDLRHFYASGLIAAGCDVVTVQRALGHAKATTTLNTYAHLWPTAEDRTRTAASELIAAALAAPADYLRTEPSV